MKQPGAIPERRIHPRHRVRVAVVWNNRNNQLMPGEICDVSSEGLFLVGTTALPDEVGIGDTMQITVHTETGNEVLVGIVRWRGYHPVHEAIGCGIRLDPSSIITANRIFPVLNHAKSRT
jgi:hypothetical protein